MYSTDMSRRGFTIGMAALPISLATSSSVLAAPSPNYGLTHTSEAILQELVFVADKRRVYEALTSTQQFEAITRLSDGEALLNAVGAKPTAISGEVGGPFTLFGGYVTGRHLEMLPGERLVQAWRAASWKPGQFSITVFSLAAQGANAKLSFEHRGFPDGTGASLAKGWYAHYWQPLAKFLAPG
jgi:activator of HSP90 ATPase